MNEIFQKLIDADLHARTVLEEAQAYLRKTYDTIDEEKAAFILSYRAKALDRIAKVNEQSDETYSEKLKAVEEKYKLLFDKLGKTYEENRARWEDELFQRCVDRW